MIITVFSSSRYKINRKLIKAKAVEVLGEHGAQKDTTLSIAFVGKNKMRTVSKTYKDENEALPVLSFPFNEKRADGLFLGEILICYPQAVLMAAHKNKRVDDIINFLVQHGIENFY